MITVVVALQGLQLKITLKPGFTVFYKSFFVKVDDSLNTEEGSLEDI